MVSELVSVEDELESVSVEDELESVDEEELEELLELEPLELELLVLEPEAALCESDISS